MKNPNVLLAILLCLVLLGSACQGGNPLEPANCQKGTCIKLDITRLAKLGEDSTFALTITSQVEEPEIMVYFQNSAPDILVDGQPAQIDGRPISKKIYVKSLQPMTTMNNIRFPREGYYLIVAHAITKDGRHVFDGLEVRVTASGITPNPPPERGPGTPAPAIKVDKTPTLRPRTPTPIPPPTRPPYP